MYLVMACFNTLLNLDIMFFPPQGAREGSGEAFCSEKLGKRLGAGLGVGAGVPSRSSLMICTSFSTCASQFVLGTIAFTSSWNSSKQIERK
jgi:hypothetical protein